MGDIVYWDGGEYLAPKAVASADVIHYPARIEVDWGNEDKEFLTGVSWVRSQVVEATGTFSQSMSASFNAAGCSGSCKSGSWGVRFISDSLSPVVLTRGGSFSNACGRHYYYFWQQDDIIISPVNDLKYSSCDTRMNNPNGWGYFGSITTEAFSSLVFGGIKIYSIKITSNTGQFSERITEINPDISELDSSCAIAITYEDATTEELPLSYCPPWVRIRREQECPEGTCSVECEDHICCYDCSGKAVLVIPK